MAAIIPKIGQTIETSDGRQGIIRYVGALDFTPGEWCGLELAGPDGKNDGSVKGHRYFTCKPGHGIFVRREAATRVLKPVPAALTAAPKSNGNTSTSTTSRPMPGGGVSADVARKRQSLMSGGSQTGSRLSMRSPTKSPVKAVRSPTSSTTSSTPRTMTPTATTKMSESTAKSRLSVGGNSMARPPTTRTRTVGHTSRPSLGSTVQASKPAQAVSGQIRSLTTAPRLSTVKRGSLQTADKTTSPNTEEAIKPPDIQEEADETPAASIPEAPGEMVEDATGTERPGNTQLNRSKLESQPTRSTVRTTRTASIGRTNMTTTVESRAAQQKEVEQMKAKIRTLEKQREGDHEKLKHVEALQNDKDRYENIIQALQKKLKGNQLELAELRVRHEQAQQMVDSGPDKSAEMESELELATLDKEMAEERAETIQAELEALRSRHEELELEIDILREENRELGSTMTPEERANTGFLQMERETDRLRQALILLRDVTQQNETDLKSEIKELRETLNEAEQTASKYGDATEKLSKAEETNRHLMEQLEAAETNDEVVEAMEFQREQQMSIIEHLRKQVQDLEEHIQVTDELETYHIDEEKRLLSQLDENEAVMNERERAASEQTHVIEDLEYTLTKFRDVVQGLQSDINELRRTREISELEAHEMTSKSRAMMDLNLRLQSSAAKSQTKVIDIELEKVQAELKSKQVDILTQFVPETFESERNPVLAMLAFGRIKSKASLVSRLLLERCRERAHLNSNEEIFSAYETVERMDGFAALCEMFVCYMNSCSTTSFAACGQAVSEVEPVERTVTGWIEALRRDELGSDSPEHLKRMQGILTDLSEKLVIESLETTANDLALNSQLAGRFADSAASMLSTCIKMVQARLGSPTDEDEESQLFDKRMDSLSTKARTISYLCTKITQNLDQMRTDSLCIGESSWHFFKDVRAQAELLASSVRKVGLAISEELADMEREQSLTYSSIIERMNRACRAQNVDSDVFGIMISNMQVLLSHLETLTVLSSDVQSAVEFEPGPAPWTVRAKEIKAQKIISAEVQQELSQLQRRNVELGTRLMEREKIIEEMTMRVELAEKRMRDIRAKDHDDKVLQEEFEKAKSDKQKAEAELQALRADLDAVSVDLTKSKKEIEHLQQVAGTDGAQKISLGGSNKVDEVMAKQNQAQVELLNTEIVSLQARLRYLRQENLALRIPVSETAVQAAKLSWLDPNLLRPKPRTSEKKNQVLEKEALDVWEGLIDVAKAVKPLKLQSRARVTTHKQAHPLPSSWRPTKDMPRFQVLQQREELEKWEGWKEDFIRRAKMASRTKTSENTRKRKPREFVYVTTGGDEALLRRDHRHDGIGIVQT